MKAKFFAGPLRFLLVIAFSATAASAALAQDHAIGQFDGSQDIGDPKLPGSAVFNPQEQEYHLTSAGTNMWFGRDQFHFVWRKLPGNFILRARAAFVGQGEDHHRKLGWMVRANLDPESPYADTAVHGDGLTSLQFRRVPGANTEEIHAAITNADVLQLERRGDTYIFSAARFGEPFVVCQVTNLALGDEPCVGLFLCSHNGEVVEQADFRNVRVIRPVKEGFVPYKDYIGCHMEILDVATGASRIIYSSPKNFEAPNWPAVGNSLIFNSGGQIWRMSLNGGEPVLIDTGFAKHCNNDHGVSPDQKHLAISDQSQTGKSMIYILPIQGSHEPRRVTELGPSYWHGWTPDGGTVAYTAQRDGKFGIYTIPASGGQEKQLTRSEGLDDGPEYSPDGRYLFFNSTRTGTMQLWRMKPDGSAPEQLTHDEFNNWFPHLSPDGKWIAFVSFSQDVSPTDHPYYKHIYIRLMPANGGTPRVIAYVYGGQGTMNVPSWSPDGRHLAFVSNSDIDVGRR